MTSSTNVRFDVGCAATAPNSAMWILKYPNIQVYAFEPDFRSYNILKYGKKTNQYPDKPRIISNKNIVLYKKKILKNFPKKNFNIYNCCIDNVAKKKIFFYYTSKKNYGCSSVKKPIEKKLKIKINYKKLVDVYPLSFFLKKKNIIEMLKTDTQGNDLQVLKSAGDYIKKVLFVQSEYWTRQVYYGEGTKEIERERVISYMTTKNFSCYYYTDIDIYIFVINLRNASKRTVSPIFV